MSTIQFDYTITLNEPTIHMRDEISQGVKLFIVDEFGDSCIMSLFKNREGEKLLYTDRQDPSEDPGYDFMKCRFWGYMPETKPVRGTVDRLLYDYPKLKDLTVFSRCTEDDESVFCIVNGNSHAEIMYCTEDASYWRDPETLEWSDDPKTIDKIYKFYKWARYTLQYGSRPDWTDLVKLVSGDYRTVLAMMENKTEWLWTIPVALRMAKGFQPDTKKISDLLIKEGVKPGPEFGKRVREMTEQYWTRVSEHFLP